MAVAAQRLQNLHAAQSLPHRHHVVQLTGAGRQPAVAQRALAVLRVFCLSAAPGFPLCLQQLQKNLVRQPGQALAPVLRRAADGAASKQPPRWAAGSALRAPAASRAAAERGGGASCATIGGASASPPRCKSSACGAAPMRVLSSQRPGRQLRPGAEGAPRRVLGLRRALLLQGREAVLERGRTTSPSSERVQRLHSAAQRAKEALRSLRAESTG